MRIRTNDKNIGIVFFKHNTNDNASYITERI